jgi:hypothetical protein
LSSRMGSWGGSCEARSPITMAFDCTWESVIVLALLAAALGNK